MTKSSADAPKFCKDVLAGVIAAVFPIGGVPGLFLCVRGRQKVLESDGRLRGGSLAIVGIGLAVLSLVGWTTFYYLQTH